MKKEDIKLQRLELEQYLSGQFHFRLNEITGGIEFKKHCEHEWHDLNEFNIYRKLKLDGE